MRVKVTHLNSKTNKKKHVLARTCSSDAVYLLVDSLPQTSGLLSYAWLSASIGHISPLLFLCPAFLFPPFFLAHMW